MRNYGIFLVESITLSSRWQRRKIEFKPLYIGDTEGLYVKLPIDMTEVEIIDGKEVLTLNQLSAGLSRIEIAAKLIGEELEDTIKTDF